MPRKNGNKIPLRVRRMKMSSTEAQNPKSQGIDMPMVFLGIPGIPLREPPWGTNPRRGSRFMALKDADLE
jgi:hypothetical protein